MKKGLRNSVMSLAALLALVSCGAPAVTEEVAKQRAQEITERREQADFEMPTKITITGKSTTDLTMKVGSEKESATDSMELKMVLDTENYYYYMGVTTSEGSMKQWGYLEGNTLIAAQESPSGKFYSEAVLESPDKYIEVLSTAINSIYETVLNNEFLQIDELDAALLKSTGLTGTFDSDISYTSSAEGNLGISAKGEVTDGSMEIQEGLSISASASVNVKVSFDNYLLTNTSVSVKVNAAEETSGVSINLVSKETLSIKYGVASLSKPNLSNFTKQ